MADPEVDPEAASAVVFELKCIMCTINLGMKCCEGSASQM